MAIKAKLNLQILGNYLALRFPKRVVHAARLAEGQTVVVEAIDSIMTIKTTRPSMLSLAQKLERFDPSRHGGESMVSGHHGSNEI